mmetsp:Transcript_51038/g.94382  ORF Transcript_51038/g.94382 Transcript_51038/m.94382 type:complete len:97 (+) Transcript_51038:1060-1350(+)
MHGAKKENHLSNLKNGSQDWQMLPPKHSARNVDKARFPKNTWRKELGKSIDGHSIGNIQNMALESLPIPELVSPAGAQVQHFLPSFVFIIRLASGS